MKTGGILHSGRLFRFAGRLIILLLVPVFFLAGCSEPEPEFAPGCSPEELLLALDDLPNGAIVTMTEAPVLESTLDSIGQTYHVNNTFLDQCVYWYPEEKYAKSKYQDVSVMANKLRVGSPELQPTDLFPGENPADDYEVGCDSTTYNGHKCFYVGRYQNYVVELNSQISDQAISLQAYTKLLETIGNKMQSCK